jgi:hypothetical protein
VKKYWRYFLLSLLVLLLVGTIGFFVWANTPYQPEAYALDSLKSNQTVHFANLNRWLVFTPVDMVTTTGLIIYPGARVDARAYAPQASAIAEAGFTVVVVPMPLNLAFFGLNRASDVIQAFPAIEHWAVGGHSLGGAMAAEFASANQTQVDGLVLWASYTAASNDLSESDLAVISIYASNDGIAALQDIQDSRARLPTNSTFVEIQGGNHAGFGWYGPQNGDGEREISKDDQQDQIVRATTAFLNSLEEKH